jgi:Co/Zn/Cd efflux system component
VTDGDGEEWTPYEPAPWRRRLAAVAAIVLGVALFVFGVFVLSNEWPRFQQWPHDPWRLLGFVSVGSSILLGAAYLVIRRRKRG